jgi:hypothetical protein
VASGRATPPEVAAVERAAYEGAEVVNADVVKLQVYVSRTAQLFHVVDQLSEWSPYCHRQYGRYFGSAAGGGLSAQDREMLKRHAAVRQKRPWGGRWPRG